MSTEKENKNIVEETVDKVVDTVKETTEKVVEAGKETVDTVKDAANEVKEAVTAPAVTKKSTWWNRIWSAIVGAVLAVAAMFGITTDQVAEQKAKTEEVKKLASEALELAKAGKIEDAKAALELAVETGKEVVTEAKKVVEKAKETKAEDVAKEAVKGAKESIKVEETKK